MKTLIVLLVYAVPTLADTTTDTTTSTAPASVEIIQTYTPGDSGEMGVVAADPTPMPDYDDTSRIVLPEDGIDPTQPTTSTGGN